MHITKVFSSAFCVVFLFQATLSAQDQETLTLKQSLEIAKQNYPAIKIKMAEKEAAAHEVKAAQINYVPNFVVQGQILDGTSNQVRGAFFPNEGMAIPVSGGIKVNGYTETAVWTSYATGFMNWKLFNFGKFKSQVESAKAGELAAQADYDNEIFQQQIKVGDAYLLSLMANEMVRSQTANLARVKALRDVTSAYTKSGLRPGVDSSLVKAEYSKAMLQLLEAQRIASEQLVYLKEQMGYSKNTVIKLDTTAYSSNQPLPLDMGDEYEKNPRLRYFKSIVDANESRIKAIRRREYPSISVIGGAWTRGSGIQDKTAPNGDFLYDKSFSAGVAFRPYLDWVFGVSTIWNITTLFKTGQEAKAQQQVTNMAQERYNEEVLRVESEVERARLGYVAAVEAARQAPIQLAAAQNAYEQAQARYNAGFSTILELTQTYALLNRAEVDASIAKGNLWRAVVRYAAATGDMDLFTRNLN